MEMVVRRRRRRRRSMVWRVGGEEGRVSEGRKTEVGQLGI